MSNADKKKAFFTLRAEVTRLVNAADPIGLLAGGAPSDEYSPEIGTLLPRLRRANSEAHLRQILHAQFVEWFDADTAGTESEYAALAADLWGIRKKWLAL